MPSPAPPAPGLGQLIRDRRIELHLSATELGNAIGVHQTTVSGWERGQGWRNIRSHLTDLADTLDIDADVLRGLWWRGTGGYATLTPVAA